MASFTGILSKLHRFIKKYYINELIKGGILFATFGLLYLIFTILIEYFLWLPTGWRSFLFFVFIGVFFPLYFMLKGKARLLLCLAGSYFFYGWWDWRFLSLILISTLIDYSVGLQLDGEEHTRKRKRLLVTSMIVNLGFLGFFKYFNFFEASFIQMFVPK